MFELNLTVDYKNPKISNHFLSTFINCSLHPKKIDKLPASGQPHKPSTRSRVRMISATSISEGITLPTSRPTVPQKVGTSQPPDTPENNLYSRIIEEAMAKFNHDEIGEGETNSIESLSVVVALSDTQTTCLTSSSSLRFSTVDESKAEENHGKKGTGLTFEEIATEVIQEMHEIERGRKGNSIETHELESHCKLLQAWSAGNPKGIPSERSMIRHKRMTRKQQHLIIGGNCEHISSRKCRTNCTAKKSKGADDQGGRHYGQSDLLDGKGISILQPTLTSGFSVRAE